MWKQFIFTKLGTYSKIYIFFLSLSSCFLPSFRLAYLCMYIFEISQSLNRQLVFTARLHLLENFFFLLLFLFFFACFFFPHLFLRLFFLLVLVFFFSLKDEKKILGNIDGEIWSYSKFSLDTRIRKLTLPVGHTIHRKGMCCVLTQLGSNVPFYTCNIYAYLNEWILFSLKYVLTYLSTQ